MYVDCTLALMDWKAVYKPNILFTAAGFLSLAFNCIITLSFMLSTI